MDLVLPDPPPGLPDISKANLTDLLASEDNELKAATQRLLDSIEKDTDGVLSAFANYVPQ